MRTVTLTFLISLTAAAIEAQTDWPAFGGDAQRTGWEKSDTRITRENIKDFEFIWKRKFPVAHAGPRALTPPVMVGLLISYRGFKELAFVTDSSDTVWSLDADLNRVFWKKELDVASAKPQSGCPAAPTAMPALVPPRVFGAKSSATGTRRPNLKGNGFGEVRPVFAVSGDGKLHKLNTADGSDITAPLDFLPAGVKASPLTIHDGTIYASSQSNCLGGQSGIWAIDLTVQEPHVVSYTWDGPSAPGLGGPAIGTDGTVYLQTAPDKISSFSANDLKPKDTIALPGNGAAPKGGLNAPTPVVFPMDTRDLIVTATSDGRLVLLDGKTIASQTAPLAALGGGIWGGISSSRDTEGNRWVFAPVWGKLNPDLKVGKTNGPVTKGAIVAFRVDQEGGKPTLTPVWVSRDIPSPVPPVITSGAVLALATAGSRAVLYGLDALTGEQLYASGTQVAGSGALMGLTVSNGRVYFTTADGTLYAFGPHFEI